LDALHHRLVLQLPKSTIKSPFLSLREYDFLFIAIDNIRNKCQCDLGLAFLSFRPMAHSFVPNPVSETVTCPKFGHIDK